MAYFVSMVLNVMTAICYLCTDAEAGGRVVDISDLQVDPTLWKFSVIILGTGHYIIINERG